MTTAKGYDPCEGRPYNRYNIYYILERERFLQSRPNYRSESGGGGEDITTGYERLGDLPPLPPRYQHVRLSSDWYKPGLRKVRKRHHKKSHGVASFQEIARIVADNWKTIDGATLDYCTAMANILKKRYLELKSLRSGSKDVEGAKPEADPDPEPSGSGPGSGNGSGDGSAKSEDLDENAPPRPNDLCDSEASQKGLDGNAPARRNDLCYGDAPDVFATSAVPLRMLSDTSVHSDNNSIHSEVDIPDNDIVAMWHRYNVP